MADNSKHDKNKPKSGSRIQTWFYIALFIAFGYLMLKDDGSELSGKATYTEFKDYMDHGYISDLVVYSNMSSMEMYIYPDSAKYIFGDRANALSPLSRPMLQVGVGSMDNLQEYIDTKTQEGTYTGSIEYRKKKKGKIE